jgi:hypothetical protein
MPREDLSVRIVVKAERSGQVIAQTEVEVKKEGDLIKQSRKAFNQFRKEHPDLSLFDDNVCIKFAKQ